MVGRQALDRLLDTVELTDPIKCLLGDRRTDSGMHVEELAPDVRPTAGLDDVAAGEQLLKPGIAVGVDDAAEVFEMGPRVLTLAIGRVEEQRCRGPFTAKRSLITHVRPQSASLG